MENVIFLNYKNSNIAFGQLFRSLMLEANLIRVVYYKQ